MSHPTAILRYLHQAPRKVRAVADLVRGMPVREAEAQLLLMPRRAATPLLKLIRSAAANARATLKREPDAFFIKEIRVDQGPKSKRWMPRARGAMSPLERKTSHVTVVLGVSPAPRASRFVIVKPSKHRAEEEKKTKGKKAEPHEHDHEHDEKETGEKKGFSQRVFRRKAV